MRDDVHCKRSLKQAVAAALMLSIEDLRTRNVTENKEGPYKIIEELFFQEVITNLILYPSSNTASKYMKQNQ